MKEKKQKKHLDLSLIFNVIMLLLFISGTVKSFMKTADEATALRPFIIVALVVYVIMFAIVILINLKDKNKLKEETGEYKYVANQSKKLVKIVKLLMNLANVATALLIALEGYKTEGFKAVFELIIAGISLIFAIHKIVKAVKKFAKAKNKHDKNKQKLAEKNQKEQLKAANEADKKALAEAKPKKAEKPKK